MTKFLKGMNFLWSVQNSGEVIIRFNLRGFRTTSLSAQNYSILNITLRHDLILIKEKIIDFITCRFSKQSVNKYILNGKKVQFPHDSINDRSKTVLLLRFLGVTCYYPYVCVYMVSSNQGGESRDLFWLFCTCIRTERVIILFSTSLILNEFLSGTM